MYNTTHKSVQDNPSAHITVRKGRVKVYDKEKQPSTIYLQGEQEFEIELFNPSQSYQLAMIEINGKLISNNGIALKPGERVYLERYLDVAKKFKFDTYEVEAGNLSVEKAIALNGIIKVRFYVENTTLKLKSNFDGKLRSRSILDSSGTTSNTYYNTTTNTTSNILGGNTSITMDWLNQECTLTSINNYVDVNKIQFDGNVEIDGTLNLNDTSTKSLNEDIEFETTSKEVKMKETGRIDQGANSNQSFEFIEKSFSNFPNTTIEYQILPLSEKLVESKDLKSYCTECGRSLKPEFKFCPVCGTKA